MFSAFGRIFSHQRVPRVVQDSALGRVAFDPKDGTWETIQDTPIYHGGIPGTVDGPDHTSIEEICVRLGKVDSYWHICSADLLYIASCYASLPQVSEPREIFRLSALSLYPTYWEICFETNPENKWIHVSMQFEGEVLVSNTIDT